MSGRTVLELLEPRRLLAASAWAFPGADGHLLYQPTALGDHIEDFSNVGYKAGLVPIPDVPVRATVAAPSGGDDTAIIQAAINSVQNMPLNGEGFRGAVLLGPGVFRIDGSLSITASGVVLRGSGQNRTLLHATTITDKSERTIIRINGSGTRSVRAGSTHTITDKYVPVGAISFSVDSTVNLHVGDTVVVHRPSTQQWIDDLGMDQLTYPWTPGSKDINLDRTISRIDGNIITIDAPITQALDQKYTDASRGPNTIYAYAANGRLSNVGVEDLGGYSDYDPAVKDSSGHATDENHPWTFINVDGSQNAWVRDISAQYFGYAAVYVTGSSKWVTVENSQMIDYVSQITGGRRYGFNIDDSSNCIFRNCYTRQGRHDYVEGSLVPGPNVFVDDRADSTHADAGPHHRYSTAALWDNLQVGQLDIQNRGNSGTGHGWAGANQVIWNSTAGSFVVQNPPAAQNWLIGSIGTIKTGTSYVGPHDPGIYDSSGPSGPNVFPRSLYYQQFAERTAYEGFQPREVRLGDSDSFTPGDAADSPSVDATWRSAIQTMTGQTGVGFDVVNNDQLIPLTFNFPLDPGTMVVGASLSLGLKSAGAGTSVDRIYIDSTSRSRGWSDLGVAPPGLAASGAVIDLSGFLAELQDGKLNLAISGNSALDWATLNLQTASIDQPITTIVPAAGDASVRDGSSANTNFGSATSLQTKLDAIGNDQESYLKFDLSAISGQLVKATMVLVPTSVGVAAGTFGSGTGAIFNQLSLVPDNSWTESGITWNNRPASGELLADFVSMANAPLNFDLTAQVQGALAGDKLLSLKLASTVQSASGEIAFASRENPNIPLRPQLILTTRDINITRISGDQDAPNENDTIRIVRNGDFVDVTRNGASALHADYTTAPKLLVSGLGGNDTVIVDFGGGNPIPPAGLSIDAGGGTGDLVSLIGSAGNDAIALDGGNVTINGATLTYSNAEMFNLATGGASDTISAAGNAGISAGAMSLTVTSGTVSLTSGSTLPDFTDLAVGAAATLNLNGQNQTIDGLNGSGTIINNGGAGATLTIGQYDGGGIFSGDLSAGNSALSLIKNGAGMQILSGTSTYTGTTSVNAGALRITSSGALGSATGKTTISGGTATGRVEFAGGITLAEPFTLGNRTGSNGGNFTPHLVNVSGSNTLEGAITLSSGGSYWTIQSDAGLLTLAGDLTNVNTSNTRTLFLRGAGGGIITGNLRQTNISQTQLDKDDAGTWTIAGSADYTGPTTVNSGVLLFQSDLIGSSAININAGVLKIQSGSQSVLKTAAFSIAGAGLLDLTDNRLILADSGQLGTWNGSTYTGITGLVASGRIITSTGTRTTRIGIARAGDLLNISDSATGTWAGQTVSGSDTLLRYTYGGDANLDGKVNIDDYGRIDANVGQNGLVFGWYNGDFNLDGKINIDDYGIIDSIIGAQGPPLAIFSHLVQN